MRPRSACSRLLPLVDELVCPAVSGAPWFAVDSFYRNWYDLTNDKVLQVLQTWRQSHRASCPPHSRLLDCLTS